MKFRYLRLIIMIVTFFFINHSKWISDTSLETYCNQFGESSDLAFEINPVNGKSLGSAQVTYPSEEIASKAIESINETPIDKCKVVFV